MLNIATSDDCQMITKRVKCPFTIQDVKCIFIFTLFKRTNTIKFGLEIDSYYCDPTLQIMKLSIEEIGKMTDDELNNKIKDSYLNYKLFDKDEDHDFHLFVHNLLNQPVPKCYVCLEETFSSLLPCKHSICVICLYKTLNNCKPLRCGMCRTCFDFDQSRGRFVIENSNESDDDEN